VNAVPLDAAGACGKVTWKILFDGDKACECNLVREIGDAETAGPQHSLNAVVADEFGSARQRYEIRHGSPGRSGLGLPHHKGPQPFANDF